VTLAEGAGRTSSSESLRGSVGIKAHAVRGSASVRRVRRIIVALTAAAVIALMMALVIFRLAEYETRLAQLDGKVAMLSQQVAELRSSFQATVSSARLPEPQPTVALPAAPAAPLPQPQLPSVIRPH